MESSGNSFEENVGIMIIAISPKRVYYVIGNSLTLHPKMIRERARCFQKGEYYSPFWNQGISESQVKIKFLQKSVNERLVYFG